MEQGLLQIYCQKDYVDVIYAEHFDMPNNICNIKKFLVRNGNKTRRTVKKAEKKLDRVCRDIRAGKVKKRGFNNISIMIGKGQNKSWAELEEKNKSSVEIDDDCIKCGLCVKLCPMDNLNLTDKGIVQNDNCIFCYRCVNACPKRAITTLIHKKPEVQYKGIKTNKTTESC